MEFTEVGINFPAVRAFNRLAHPMLRQLAASYTADLAYASQEDLNPRYQEFSDSILKRLADLVAAKFNIPKETLITDVGLYMQDQYMRKSMAVQGIDLRGVTLIRVDLDDEELEDFEPST